MDKYKANDIISKIGRSYMDSEILFTAVELDLFSRLKGWRNSSTLAKSMELDGRALNILLTALCSMGLLERNGGKFKTNEISSLLDRKNKNYLGHSILHMKSQRDSWLNLKKTVQTGVPVKLPGKNGDEKGFENFQKGLSKTGSMMAGKLLEKLDFSEVKRMVDLGGGLGAYSCAFLAKNPLMEVVLFDTEDAINLAKKQELRGCRNIKFMAGDFMNDGFGKFYDLVFLSNIIHIYDEKNNKKLFNKIFKSLNPGGRIVVKDFFMNDSLDGPKFSALFAVNMLIHTESGGVYTLKDVKKWLASAGFTKTRTFALTKQTKVIEARK